MTFLSFSVTIQPGAPPLSGGDLLKLLESMAVVPEVNLATIRHTTYMMFNRAEYGPVILGHFGLNLGAYTTSPRPSEGTLIS